MKILVFLENKEWELLHNVDTYSMTYHPTEVIGLTIYRNPVNTLIISGSTKNKKYTLEYQSIEKFYELPDDAELIKSANGKPIGYKTNIIFDEEKTNGRKF